MFADTVFLLGTVVLLACSINVHIFLIRCILAANTFIPFYKRNFNKMFCWTLFINYFTTMFFTYNTYILGITLLEKRVFYNFLYDTICNITQKARTIELVSSLAGLLCDKNHKIASKAAVRKSKYEWEIASHLSVSNSFPLHLSDLSMQEY